MNERIRELAHEAGLPTYNPEGIPTKLEKFAELIVRDCLDTVSKTSLDHNKSWYVPQGQQSIGWNNAVDHILKELKKQFGVE